MSGIGIVGINEELLYAQIVIRVVHSGDKYDSTYRDFTLKVWEDRVDVTEGEVVGDYGQFLSVLWYFPGANKPSDPALYKKLKELLRNGSYDKAWLKNINCPILLLLSKYGILNLPSYSGCK